MEECSCLDTECHTTRVSYLWNPDQTLCKQTELKYEQVFCANEVLERASEPWYNGPFVMTHTISHSYTLARSIALLYPMLCSHPFSLHPILAILAELSHSKASCLGRSEELQGQLVRYRCPGSQPCCTQNHYVVAGEWEGGQLICINFACCSLDLYANKGFGYL